MEKLGGEWRMATLEGAKKKYQAAMRIAYEHDKYAEGLATFFGVRKSDVVGAEPVKSWKAQFDTDEDRRAKAETWAAKLKAAFGLS